MAEALKNYEASKAAPAAVAPAAVKAKAKPKKATAKPAANAASSATK